MKEEWRDVVGFEERYSISNRGRLYSYISDKILKPYAEPKGYTKAILMLNGNKCTHYIHLLVLTAFKGKRSKGMECNHIDENKHNNNIDNLEWVTSSQNKLHSNYPGTGSYENSQRFANNHRTPVIEIHSNKWWPSQKAAELALGLPKKFITHQLRGHCYNRHYYQFKRVNKEVK